MIVINEEFRGLPFLKEAMALDPRIVTADPGAERQDSVSNGLDKVHQQHLALTDVDTFFRQL